MLLAPVGLAMLGDFGSVLLLGDFEKPCVADGEFLQYFLGRVKLGDWFSIFLRNA